jgi:hypothetical protein
MKRMILVAFAVMIAAAAAAEQEKAPGLTGIAQETARLNQSKTLTPEQIETIVQEKAAGHARRVAEQHPPAQAAAPTPFRGIIDAKDVPNPFRPNELTIINFWGGEKIGVYSGYRPDDPSRGVLVVFDGKDNTRGTCYDVPAAPMAIASFVNGALLLQTRGQSLTFNLSTRRFK